MFYMQYVSFTFLHVKFSVVRATCQTEKPDKLPALMMTNIVRSKNIFNHNVKCNYLNHRSLNSVIYIFCQCLKKMIVIIISSQSYLGVPRQFATPRRSLIECIIYSVVAFTNLTIYLHIETFKNNYASMAILGLPYSVLDLI
jgi:hypothetical protein